MVRDERWELLLDITNHCAESDVYFVVWYTLHATLLPLCILNMLLGEKKIKTERAGIGKAVKRSRFFGAQALRCSTSLSLITVL